MNLFVILLWTAPVAVASLSLGVIAASGLVALLLLWRWMRALSAIGRAAPGPALVLESISASHFVEKVRWCMDRLGVDYVERPFVGVIGIVFTGRTVPRLLFRTGMVQSSIGNSAEILRYLWGRYAAEDGVDAEFLAPTPEALQLEQECDAYGVALQRWIYGHALPDRRFTLHVWGANDPERPWWQRAAVRLLYPVLRMFLRRAFRLNSNAHASSTAAIEKLLGNIEARLGDGRRYLLDGDQLHYTDITFASLSCIWSFPPEFAAGGNQAVRPELGIRPAGLVADAATWQARYPLAGAFIERVYREERMPAAA